MSFADEVKDITKQALLKAEQDKILAAAEKIKNEEKDRQKGVEDAYAQFLLIRQEITNAAQQGKNSHLITFYSMSYTGIDGPYIESKSKTIKNLLKAENFTVEEIRDSSFHTACGSDSYFAEDCTTYSFYFKVTW